MKKWRRKINWFLNWLIYVKVYWLNWLMGLLRAYLYQFVKNNNIVLLKLFTILPVTWQPTPLFHSITTPCNPFPPPYMRKEQSSQTRSVVPKEALWSAKDEKYCTRSTWNNSPYRNSPTQKASPTDSLSSPSSQDLMNKNFSCSSTVSCSHPTKTRSGSLRKSSNRESIAIWWIIWIKSGLWRRVCPSFLSYWQNQIFRKPHF